MSYSKIFELKHFPFINHSLYEDLKGLSMKDNKIYKLKFAKNYELEYTGEIAERWHTRKMVTNQNDFIALNLGLAEADSSEFLYDQKEMFVNSAVEYLNDNWDLTAALAVMYFATKHRMDIDEVEKLKELYSTMTTNQEEIKGMSKVIFTINLTIKTNHWIKHHSIDEENNGWRKLICSLMDQLEFDLGEPHEDFPLLLLLSDVYKTLEIQERPKAKEFKTKGMIRILQSLSALRYKEIDDRRSSIEEYLNIRHANSEDVFTYNYLLAVEQTETDHRDSTITEPGYERIRERYLKSQFLSEKPVLDEVLKRLDKDKERNENNKLFNLKKLLYHVDKFMNTENLRLFLKYAEDVLLDDIRISHISLIKKDVINNSVKKSIIRNLLRNEWTRSFYSQHSRSLNQEQFEYLQKVKDELNFDAEINQHYFDLCVKFGRISIENTEELKEKELISYAIENMRKNNKFEDIIDFLELFDKEYHEVLLQYTNTFKENLEGNTLKSFYELYLDIYFYKNPSSYAKTVYELLKDDSFSSLFEFTQDEIDEIEKEIYNQSLLTKTEAEELYRKYTPAEVLEQERIEKVIKHINSFDDLWDMKRKMNSHIEDAEKYEEVKNALVEKFKTIQLKGISKVEEFFTIYYRLKKRNFVTEQDIEELEERAYSLVA